MAAEIWVFVLVIVIALILCIMYPAYRTGLKFRDNWNRDW